MIVRYYKSFSAKRIYICPYPGCTLRTNNFQRYINHRKTHAKPFVYQCKEPNCGQNYSYSRTLGYHKKTKHQPSYKFLK
ncbi:zinc finger protein [Loa loa]|uniref:Zinc finger protein n=1 Tax=Loa loa TaxID=7209 RepID=A0A1S0TM21_LOALO|nr:zinc finger protein [Loa loa]EFO16524.1 zinc finger protein [Loa loa]